MKKIFGIALMFAVVAGGMTANAQTSNTPSKDKTEQCDRKDKKDCKDHKCNKYNKYKKEHKGSKDTKDRKEFKGKKNCQRMSQHKGQRPDLFAGITLSQEQQSKLNALKAESKAQHKAEKADLSDKLQRNQKDRQARRAEFSAKVKEILTPEQNVDKMKTNRKQRKG